MTDRHETSNSLIQVPRDLIRECERVLSPMPGWRRHPLKSLKQLIYGLNGLYAWHQLFRYNHGLRRPSEVKRELEGILSWADKGNSNRIAARLADLDETNRDSFNLILFQMALEIAPDHPERAVQDPETLIRLVDLSRSDPKQIATLAERAIASVDSHIKEGRGGNRNYGKLVEREIVFELGCIFAECTGRNPGITFDNHHNYNNFNGIHTGPFVRFVQIVSEELGHTLNGRQILNIYSSLDVPEWRSGKTGGWSAT